MNPSNEFQRPLTTPIPDMRSDLGHHRSAVNQIQRPLNQGEAMAEGNARVDQAFTNQTLDALYQSTVANREVPGQTGQGRPTAPMVPGPSKIEDIHIQQLDRGFIVKVGCQTVAVSDKNELIGKLTAYISNPDKVRELYFSNLF